MGRFQRLLLAAAAPRSRLPAFANAEERTLTFTTPAISVEGYGVAQQPMLAGVGQRLRLDAAAGHRSRPSLRAAGVLDAAAAGPYGQGVTREVHVGRGLPLWRRARPAPARHHFTWNFRGWVQHDVTVVGGPVGLLGAVQQITVR